MQGVVTTITTTLSLRKLGKPIISRPVETSQPKNRFRTYNSKEVCSIAEIGVSFLNEATRSRPDRQVEKPLFIPFQPGQGQGSKDIYSFSDLVLIKSLDSAKKALVNRLYLTAISTCRSQYYRDAHELNPFSPKYLSDYKKLERRSRKDGSDLKDLLDPLNPRVILKIGPHQGYLIYEAQSINLHGRYDPLKLKDFSKLGMAKLDPNAGAIKKPEKLSEDEMKDILLTIPLKVEIDLSRIHFHIRRRLHELGIDALMEF